MGTQYKSNMTRTSLFNPKSVTKASASNNGAKGRKQKQKNPSKEGVQSAPAARGVRARTSVPQVSGAGGVVRVTHREFVGSVTNGSVTGFALTAVSASTPGYDLNPASSIMFPWLANVATSFERYRFNSMSFKFVPSSPTSTAGRFYAAVDYDYDDPVPLTKQGLMTNASAIEVPVWMEAVLSTRSNELHRDQPFKYVSTQTRNNFVEPRTAYCGYLMCAFDTPTVNLLYDIWVEYTVEFHLPVCDPVDTIASATPVLTDTAALTSVGGGATKWGLLDILPVVNSALKIVAPGNVFTPFLDLVTPVGATLCPTTAYDIRGCRNKSIIEVIGEYIVTGATPAAVLGAAVGTPVYAFDDKGGYLGQVTPATFQTGPKVPADILNVNQRVRSYMGIHVDDIWAAFSKAAYLAVTVASAGALGAGAGSFGTRYTH